MIIEKSKEKGAESLMIVVKFVADEIFAVFPISIYTIEQRRRKARIFHLQMDLNVAKLVTSLNISI